ncbi:hypothetical protein [Deinococcus aquiradiocola]|uniref:Alpha/beta hydrolase n=1 Tax=Deinococcus aquiradiocola TaxID=393059 RepID=A0A917UTJ8_9DEIO|nr:hypothetical protein [Deinococcus aquiradiocola]GGJ84077.1 hypothetical protein GCM10008939_29950 [Deinococcus aquiradiocola]
MRTWCPALALAVLLAACGTTTPSLTATTPATTAPAVGTGAAQPGLPAGFGEALTATSARTTGTALGTQALACPTTLAAPYDASTLDTGLYWYAPSESGAPGGVGCKARSDGAAIAGYYDPARPVIVFVHGWQNGSVQSGLVSGSTRTTARENFFFQESGTDVADAWIARGWNVALYQWTQLADDEGTVSAPYHAQAKIWTPGYTYVDTLGRTQDIRMRYRVAGGAYSTLNMPTVSAGSLFYTAYRSALSRWNYTGAEGVRVMGHSLGAQMALSLSQQAYADPALPARERPARLILADPYWTPATPAYGHTYGFLAPDASPAARAVRIVTALKPQGLTVEWLKSSRVNDLGGDNNTALAGIVSRTEIFPEYVLDLNPATGLARKHSVAPRWYLWSASFAPGGAVSAANTLTAARNVMNAGVRFDQQTGRGSVTPSDDTFVSAPNP